MTRTLRALLLVTDLGFLAYWALTLGHVLPREWLFRGYDDPTISAWNLSFLPLDLLVSGTGLGAVFARRHCPAASRVLVTISLVTTSVSGLQALAFWTLRHDFDLGWWAPNVALLVWPLPFLAQFVWRAELPASGIAEAEG